MKYTKKHKKILMNSKILYPDESYAIMGACFNVYKEMGNGFLEAVYQECLEMEFSEKKIPFETQKDLQPKLSDLGSRNLEVAQLM